MNLSGRWLSCEYKKQRRPLGINHDKPKCRQVATSCPQSPDWMPTTMALFLPYPFAFYYPSTSQLASCNWAIGFHPISRHSPFVAPFFSFLIYHPGVYVFLLPWWLLTRIRCVSCAPYIGRIYTLLYSDQKRRFLLIIRDEWVQLSFSEVGLVMWIPSTVSCNFQTDSPIWTFHFT